MQRAKTALRGACASVVLTAAPMGLAAPIVSNVVAVTGMADPGGSGTFTTMDYTFGIRGGAIALRASTTGAFPADDGDWRYTLGGGLQQVVFNNQVPVNEPGSTVFGPGRVALDPNGDVAFVDLGTGLTVLRGGLLTNIANGNTIMPGTSGQKFALFGQPAINDAGYVAFQSGQGLWTDAYGNGLQSVAMVGQAAPGGGTYQSIDDSARIAGTRIINTAVVSVPSGTTTTTVRGIFAHTPTSDQVIARVGDASPNFTGYSYFMLGTPFTNNVGRTSFHATLTQPGTASIDAILAEQADGLHVVAATNQVAPGAGGTFFSMSNPVSNDKDQVAFSGNANFQNALWSNASGRRRG